MCGIVGYIGNKEKKDILLSGMQDLEYRGYDSSGIAIIRNKELSYFKSAGKISNLIEKMKNYQSFDFGIGIGHTRWATHGKPTEINSHPHLGNFSFVVHNGIIENYSAIKTRLEKQNINFISQTDTEVIIHLFEKHILQAIESFKAFKNTILALRGAFAILLISKTESETIFFAKYKSPLEIGFNKDEIFFASSDIPLIGKATEVYYLDDGDYGYAKNGQVFLFNGDKSKTFIKKKLNINKSFAKKNGYRFFMEKEIFEQKDIVSDTLLGRINKDEIIFEELKDTNILEGIDNILISACGTSYHSGLTSFYLFERLAKIKCSVEIASEFRYREPLLNKNTLFISISQSGETADTLESLKMVKEAGLKTLAICNVDNSPIVRNSNYSILTRAGIEIGVASTKAFSSQILVLWMLVLYIAGKKGTMSKIEIEKEINIILQVPNTLSISDKLHSKITRLSKRYLHGHGFFFIGRDIFYPLALEGALKLKEISYLHATGYPAGEMKHGPIALADIKLFTIVFMPSSMHYEKTKSNAEELIARDSIILAISPKDFDVADDFIKTKYSSHPMLEFLEMMIIVQLLSLEISIRLKNNIDMPKNLAKCVAVE